MTFESIYKDTTKPFFETWVDNEGNPMVYYDATTDIEFPTESIPWAVVSVNFLGAKQITISNHFHEKGYEGIGRLSLDIYSPSMKGVDSNGYTIGLSICDDIIAKYRKSMSNCVCFKNHSMKNKGLDGSYYHFVIELDFSYYNFI